MRHLFRLFVTAGFVCLATLNSTAQEVYALTESHTTHRVDTRVEIMLDHTREASFEDIMTPMYQQKFQKAESNLTFGYLKANIWLRLKLKSDNAREWFLEIPAPFLEYVDFYQWNGEQWTHSESGYYRPQRVRAQPHTGHALPLAFAPDSLATVYIKIAGDSPKTFPLFIIEKNTLMQGWRAEDVGYGIFFGILIVMFFYNLFIFVALRQVTYLLYIITIIFTFFIFSSASGYAGLYLWPDHPQLNFWAGRMSLPFQGIAVALFTIRFLEVKKYSRIMYYVVLSLIPLSILAAILLVTGTLSSAGNNLITLGVIVYMTAGIVCRIRGNVTANYFIMAWTIYLIGGLFLTLRNSGFFPYNFLTTHFVEVGAALETVIIAFALAAHYRRLRVEKEDAQILALKLHLENTEKLEVKVQERTEQLSKLNENLRKTLETNKIQTQIIEEKNAELDSFFYRISHDLKGPISSLRGLSSLARMDVHDQTALSYFEKQQKQVDRLDHIINGLINLTRLNQSHLEKTLIDFHKLTDDCIQSFQAHPKFRFIDFRKQIEPDLGFHSEWTLMNAILQNLVENAIKYSGEEEPFVRIRISKVTEHLTLEVEDNGQGIPPEHQSKIFEMFYRATHNTSGSGLGLYILKRSVDRLRGAIDMTSQERKGSTFTVTLPY